MQDLRPPLLRVSMEARIQGALARVCCALKRAADSRARAGALQKDGSVPKLQQNQELLPNLPAGPSIRPAPSSARPIPCAKWRHCHGAQIGSQSRVLRASTGGNLRIWRRGCCSICQRSTRAPRPQRPLLPPQPAQDLLFLSQGRMHARSRVSVQANTPKSQTPNPKSQTPNPKPQTPNPKPQTPNTQPLTPSSDTSSPLTKKTASLPRRT